VKFRAVTKKRANNFRGLLFAAPGILRQKEVASLHRQASGLPVTKVQGWWWWWWWRDSKFPPTQYLGISVRYPAHLCRPTTGAACNSIALLIAYSQWPSSRYESYFRPSHRRHLPGGHSESHSNRL